MKGVSGFVLVLSALSTACGGGGGSSSPSQPSGPSTSTTTYTVPLAAANENPPVTNADAGISATATIALTATKDGSGNVTSASVNFQVSGTGFPQGTTVTSAHIHSGGSAANGAIVCNTGVSSGDIAVANGSGAFSKNGVAMAPDVAQAILQNPGNFYFNVHTALNPDGAVRGQLASGGSPGNPGPTPPGY